jgi:hypothetical protein
MKRNVGLVVLLGSLAGAWSSPELFNVCNSAAPANGTVYVNADIWDVPRDDITVTLFYSFDNQATWQSVPMQVVGGAGYDSTFRAVSRRRGPAAPTTTSGPRTARTSAPKVRTTRTTSGR